MANENMIEFLKGQERAAVKFSQPRLLSRIRKLSEQYPEEVAIIQDQDENGNFVAHIPAAWIKITPPRQIDPEKKKITLHITHSKPFHGGKSAHESEFDSKVDSLYLPGGLEPFYDEISGILTWA